MLQVLYLVVQSSESCTITTAENPCDHPPVVAINGFDEPKFLFLTR
jgi:hypothetical protein